MSRGVSCCSRRDVSRRLELKGQLWKKLCFMYVVHRQRRPTKISLTSGSKDGGGISVFR